MNNGFLVKLGDNKNSILTNIATAAITAIAVVMSAIFWYQDTRIESYINSVEENRNNIGEQMKRIRIMSKDLDKVHANFESQIEEYIDMNYGEFSKRDEKVEKLIFLHRQQEKRLLNIEEAFSKF